MLTPTSVKKSLVVLTATVATGLAHAGEMTVSAAAIEKVGASLNPGGLSVSNHWFCAPGCAVEESAVQGLSKALQSFGHPLCSEEEFDRLFAEKGFDIVTTTSAWTAFEPTRLQLAEKREEQP